MLHRRRVRRGPDHGHDRAEVPAHRGRVSSFAFASSISGFVSKARMRVQNLRSNHRAFGSLCALFSTPPMRREKSETKDESSTRPKGRTVDGCGGLLSPSFVPGLSLSLSRDVTLIFGRSLLSLFARRRDIANDHYRRLDRRRVLLRTKRSPWSI